MTRRRIESIANRVCESGMEVKVVEVDKINGTRFGIVLQGVTCAPTLYLDEFSDHSDDELVEFVINTMDRSKERMIFIDDLFQPENVIGFIINTSKNEKLINNAPHIDILDLSICFRFSKNGESCVINNAIAKQYGYSVERLYQLANENATPQIASLQSILFNLDSDIDLDIPLMVITNENRYFGAFEGFLLDNLKEVARNLDSDLIIIPSSIHECLILPTDECDVDYVRQMVYDVNNSILGNEEILSFNIYKYVKFKNEIHIL